MIATGIRWVSLIATGFVVLSFVLFAVNQTSNASQNQVNAITGDRPNVKAESVTKIPDPPKDVEKLREQENSGLHEFIDDGDDILLAPFTGINNSSSIWVRRLIPLGLALALYFFLGQYLARAAGMRRP